jgi:ankyrin repeat protein
VAPDARSGPKQHTLLQMAAMHGQLRIVKLLLRNKAGINDINLEGNTAAHLAFQFKYAEIGEYLRSKGADVRIKNLKHQTCFDMEVEGDGEMMLQGRS